MTSIISGNKAGNSAHKAEAPYRRTGRMFVTAGLMAATIVLGTSSLVFAQSSEVQALINRINQLELNLNDVQRQIYSGTPPTARPATTTPSSFGSGAGAGNTDGLAILSQKINGLETEQRRLTGIQEEATFKIDQMTIRLDKLVKDVDFRLTEIERKLGGGGAALAVTPPLSGQASTTAPVAPGTVVANGGSLPAGSKVLGTLAAPDGQTATAAIAPTTGQTVTANARNILPSGSPSDQYNFAISLVRADQYDDAEAAFTEFLVKNKGHELAGNAQYWLGETFYVRGDFPNAPAREYH